MKTKLIILSIAVLCLSTAPAMANLIVGTSLQDELDALTTNPATGSSIDVQNDNIPDTLDSIWENTAYGSVHAMIIELAGWADDNTFGVYEPGDTTNFLEIFDGSGSVGDARTLYIDETTGELWLDAKVGLADATFQVGGQFGYYLDSSANNGGGVFYSDTDENSDDLDHMYAYQGVGDTMDLPGAGSSLIGPSYYILAWEDQDKSIVDYDYNDMVVLVESVAPIPVPGAVLLGILGLSAAGIKLRRFA